MRLLPALLFLLGFAPAFAQTAPPLTLHDLKEADALGADLYANSGATGLVLVVVRGDQTFIRGYGETAPGSGIAPSADSVIRLCSLTKIFTADMLAKLVADGTVHLDDPLTKYAPAGIQVPEKAAPITLLELATHTAGLDREIGTAPRHTPHFTYPDFPTRWQWLEASDLKFTPGTQAYYSNVGFDFLGDALANAAHTSYSALLWSRTLKPLNLWETTYYPTAAQCARLMQSARFEGPCTATENTAGSSGLYSTPSDIAKWLRYLVGPNTPASPAQLDAAHAIYLLPSSLKFTYGLDHAGRPDGIGLGWMHLGANDDLSHVIQKTGGGAGFSTYIAIHPASHTALFVAATDGPPHAAVSGFRFFHASTDGLLALAGLPPLPEFSRRHAASLRLARATPLPSRPALRKSAVKSSQTRRASIYSAMPAKAAAVIPTH